MLKNRFIMLLACSIAILVFLSRYAPLTKGESVAVIGIASWYGGGEKLNKYTASGEVFDPEARTCASWDYPFGVFLRVTCLETGNSVVVKVNDRGPARRLHRLVDLSRRAFAEIAPLSKGVIKVKVEVVDNGYGGP